MRFLCALALFFLLVGVSLAADEAEIALTPVQQQFRNEVAAKAAALEKKNVGAMAGADGWLFLTSELRFLAQARFWGAAAAKTSRSGKSEHADPLPAIIDFHRQLRERGIDLLLVPVPAKAAIYHDKLIPEAKLAASETSPDLPRFYDVLQARGIEVLDLTSTFAAQRALALDSVFCKTDSHWSGLGCMLAAQAIAERVRAKLPAPPARKEYAVETKEVGINADLIGLLPSDVTKPPPEKISIRAVTEKANGAGIQPDAKSPLLILGDSHTLVFHDFHAEKAGLIDQLTHELGFAPDLIGTRGSGATAVRVSLYRRGRSDPGYLARKKVVVWCFAAREFTEADQGWVPQPVGKQ